MTPFYLNHLGGQQPAFLVEVSKGAGEEDANLAGFGAAGSSSAMGFMQQFRS